MLWLLKLGITMLISNKDDIEFVTEFPCLLGHPVHFGQECKLCICSIERWDYVVGKTVTKYSKQFNASF